MRRSEGTLQTLREPLPWPDSRPFRILSIDGGGILGILPASVLARLEERHLGGQSVGDYFDLIAGTSTGGIIALALSLGMPATKIKQLHLAHGAEIFPSKGAGWLHWRSAVQFVAGLGRYRYEQEPLELQLRKVFQDTLIGDAKRRLCIPTFDGFTEVNVFKTPPSPRLPERLERPDGHGRLGECRRPQPISRCIAMVLGILAMAGFGRTIR